jgi:hypothetical protein
MAKPRYRYAFHARIIANGHKSVKAFCEKIGIYDSCMSEIINGKRYPGKTALRAIAGGLRITLSELEALLDA